MAIFSDEKSLTTTMRGCQSVIDELMRVKDVLVYDRKGFVRIGRTNKEIDNMANIRIDRGTIFGNPYTVAKYGREDCCIMYEHYFHYRATHDVLFRSTLHLIATEIIRGRDVNLLCHCFPNQCHGETIKNYLEKIT